MELFETMLQHTSVRSFTQQKLTDELREQLILSAQSASSSNFLQAFSIIEITDAKKRKKIEQIANFPVDNGEKGALYIFVADLNKHAQAANRKIKLFSKRRYVILLNLLKQEVELTKRKEKIKLSLDAYDSTNRTKNTKRNRLRS